jgi:hypothetical protein
MNVALVSVLHRQRAALVALRDRAAPRNRWLHDEEIEQIDRRLANVRALKVTRQDEVSGRLRAAHGEGSPPKLDGVGAAARRLSTPRRIPRARAAAHRPAAKTCTRAGPPGDEDGDPEPGPGSGRPDDFFDGSAP